MRVDLTTNGLGQPESRKTGRSGQSGAASSAGAGSSAGVSAGVTGGDRAQFSFDQARVQALTAQALAAPEVRQAKVAALGQAISSGEYTVDAGKVADAMTAAYNGASFR